MGKNKKKNKQGAAGNETAEKPEQEEAAAEGEDKEMTDGKGDGVKLLEEVFGSKASVSSTGASDDGQSSKSADSKDGGSTDGTSTKTEEAKGPEAASAIGPQPPADDEFDEEEIKKAEEYKSQGNDYFKSKQLFCGN